MLFYLHFIYFIYIFIYIYKTYNSFKKVKFPIEAGIEPLKLLLDNNLIYKFNNKYKINNFNISYELLLLFY